MDIIIIIGIIVGIMIVTCLFFYFNLKEDTNARISKNIVYFFKDQCKDDLDELVEFSKSNDTKYKI